MTGFHAGEAKKTVDLAVDDKAEVPTADEWKDAKELIGDLAGTLHEIASRTNEPGSVRHAINALIRNDLISREMEL